MIGTYSHPPRDTWLDSLALARFLGHGDETAYAALISCYLGKPDELRELLEAMMYNFLDATMALAYVLNLPPDQIIDNARDHVVTLDG